MADQSPQDPRRWLAAEPGGPLPGRRRRRLLAGVLLTLLATTAIAVGVLSWLVPAVEPTFVPLWITRSADGRGYVPWSEQDRVAFEEGKWFGDAGNAASANPGRDLIRLRLDALRRQPAWRPVVLYLSAPACREPAGPVYLLPGDAVGDSPRNRLPLRDILEALRDCPARQKLLVLDLAWQPAVREPGTVCDDVPAGVLAELESTADPHRLALCSCGPGETGHGSAELGRTVFGFYLEEGLRGAADGWPPGDRDGRVTARELAAFAQGRVERWARMNRSVSQRPVLVGSAPDFTIRTLTQRTTEPAPAPSSEPPPYPEWLQAAWRQRDRWVDSGRARSAPQLFHELEDRLVDAEQAWHAGRPPAEVQARLTQELAALDVQAANFARLPTPEPPPTLALARLAPGVVDRAVTEQLRRAVLQAEARPRPAPTDKAAAPTLPPELEPLRGKPHATVAVAAFEVLTESPRPPAQRVRLLQQLLGAQQPVPLYAETLLLRRLAELADLAGDANWPATLAGALVEATQQIEDVGAESALFPWLARPLAEAEQLRHDAEAALFAPGFVSGDVVAERVRLAREAARRLHTHAQTLRSAQAVAEEAFAVVPGALRHGDQVPTIEPLARAAADSAAQLADALRPVLPAPGFEELDAKVRDLEPRQAAARRDLDALYRPLRPDVLAALRRRAESGGASPAVLRELHALLRLPLLPASERLGLRQTAASLAWSLNEDTLAVDRLEPMPRPTDGALAAPASGDPAESAALDRARRSVALFRLAGVDGPELTPLVTAAQRLDAARRAGKDTAAAYSALARALEDAWRDSLRGRRSDARAVSVLGPAPGAAASGAADPLAAEQQQRARRLWAWQATRFAYESRDPTDPLSPAAGAAFADAAARVFRSAAGGAPEIEQFAFVPGRPPALSSAVPAMTYRQRFVLSGPTEPREVPTRFYSPNDAWLPAPPPASVSAGPTGEGVIPVRIDGTGSQPGSAGGLGLFVEARVGSRSYHERLPVDLDALTNRVEVLMAAGVGATPAPLRPLMLRPIPERQPVRLFLRNPAAAERAVVLRLPGLGRETAKVVLPPKKLEPVTFLPPAVPVAVALVPAPPGAPVVAPAGPTLVELREPLAIELLAADTREVVQSAVLQVSVADPSRYVDAEEVVFAPAAGGPNRLSARLSASASLPGAPCPVDMLLPPERNPGIGLRDGKLSGVLPPDTKPLTLYAEGLVLPPGADRAGLVTFNVDGCERALTFAGTFAHAGPPVRLSPVIEPSVRLRVADFARGDRPLPVRVEVDNGPDGSRLELRLGRLREEGFVADAVRNLPAARDRSVAFAVNPADSALLFQASLRDWETTFPVEQIVGRRQLQARLLDRAGVEIAADTRVVTFDVNVPDRVQILDPPARARRDQPLVLKATGDPSVSGVKEVVFFFGKPLNGSLPANAVTFAAQPSDDKGVIWRAALAPGDRKGKTDVSVQLTNRAGFSQFDTVSVDLLDAAEFLKPEPGTIEGVVREGPIRQGGLKVYLLDAKNTRVADATTKPDGTFKFDNVTPGAYTLYSAKTATNRAATRPVEVQAGKTAKVELELFL